MLSNSARDVDNVALKHDETMLMNARWTQSLVVLLMLRHSGAANNRISKPSHPDLEGVWNFSSDIPFQRPEEFGYRDARRNLNNSDASQCRSSRGRPGEPGCRHGAPSTDERFVYGYDHFWYEMAPIADAVRTSQIIYPKNGQLPA